MPAQYSPDFLVRTDDAVYVVETKAQSALSDENVQRKQRAALAWCRADQRARPEQRDDRDWHYVLLGESIVREWHKKNVRCSELLEYAQLRRPSSTSDSRASLICVSSLPYSAEDGLLDSQRRWTLNRPGEHEASVQPPSVVTTHCRDARDA